jgi:hypothetical protein
MLWYLLWKHPGMDDSSEFTKSISRSACAPNASRDHDSLAHMKGDGRSNQSACGLPFCLRLNFQSVTNL